MKTFSAKPHEVKRDWFVVDATDKVLGRLGGQIARRLRGKHKPIYTPHVDTGDFIVVVNAEKLRVTGNKAEDKTLLSPQRLPRRHLRRPISPRCRRASPAARWKKRSRACCPRDRSAMRCCKKLKVYAGAAHPHAAQQPKTLEI